MTYLFKKFLIGIFGYFQNLVKFAQAGMFLGYEIHQEG
jgi:hypothetical protein